MAQIRCRSYHHARRSLNDKVSHPASRRNPLPRAFVSRPRSSVDIFCVAWHCIPPVNSSSYHLATLHAVPPPLPLNAASLLVEVCPLLTFGQKKSRAYFWATRRITSLGKLMNTLNGANAVYFPGWRNMIGTCRRDAKGHSFNARTSASLIHSFSCTCDCAHFSAYDPRCAVLHSLCAFFRGKMEESHPLF